MSTPTIAHAYRNKSSADIVTAIQWDGTTEGAFAVNRVIGVGVRWYGRIEDPPKPVAEAHELRVKTEDGTVSAPKDAWVVRDGAGELSVLDAETFAAEYEAVG